MVCGGAKFFGSALLIQCTVFASPRALFHYVGKCLQGSVRVQLVSSWTSCLPSRRSDVITTFFLAVVVYRRLDITSNWWGASRHFSWTGCLQSRRSAAITTFVVSLVVYHQVMAATWNYVKVMRCKPALHYVVTALSTFSRLGLRQEILLSRASIGLRNAGWVSRK